MANWKVTAVLSSPLCGDAPYLDGLLEYEMAQRHGKAYVLDRGVPAPPVGEIHLPCLRGDFAGVRGIPRCSAPILGESKVIREHFAKRIAVEYSSLLSEDSRKVVATGNSWTKSYRLPIPVRRVEKIVWFVGGSKRRSLKTLLRSVHSIGHKRSQGFGRVSEWCFEEIEHDWSWFAPSEIGLLLMRVLPFGELPEGLVGYRRGFAGFAPPYWHPDRAMEVVCPV